jgi:hypothetical protein
MHLVPAALGDRFNHQHFTGAPMTNLRRHTLITLLSMSFVTGAAVAATDVKTPATPAAASSGTQLSHEKEKSKSVASSSAPQAKKHHKKTHHKKSGKAEHGKKAEPSVPTSG